MDSAGTSVAEQVNDPSPEAHGHSSDQFVT